MERKNSHECSLCSGASCALCGEKCLKFESPVLVCHGPCNQRIKKNTVYFVAPDASAVWCLKCYAVQPAVSEGTAGPRTSTKRSVLKRRTDEEVAEPWVG